ncbi:LytR/AlgR family response regulator transcription factor [Parapedobacter lycopersici]|uniref:LytR/AlgR family response regulator transcription factor n=1 Tax=Parapedobacter lycopersici TaxID=1864939 RepID=UPI00214D3C81|nr:LytTR family DNA-binding domain-containing protein [Parapedobacter lycopersici]
MGKQTILIVDSDPSVRLWLREYIKHQPYPFVFWECCNGLEAEKYINALQPDLVFIAVQLPGKSGFAVMDSAEYQPSVIFTSTSTQDAAKAFEHQAIDYLIKPLTAERVKLALQRFDHWRGAAHKKSTASEPQISYPVRILAEKGQRLTSIPVNKITHLKADKDYTWIHMLNGESYLSTTGIGQLERKLNPQCFIRIHRSYIINIDHIQELYRDISKLFVSLPNAIEINVGRNYIPAVKELIF